MVRSRFCGGWYIIESCVGGIPGGSLVDCILVAGREAVRARDWSRPIRDQNIAVSQVITVEDNRCNDGSDIWASALGLGVESSEVQDFGQWCLPYIGITALKSNVVVGDGYTRCDICYRDVTYVLGHELDFNRKPGKLRLALHGPIRR